MFCKNCGNELRSNAKFCGKCGVLIGNGDSFCQYCGGEITQDEYYCSHCGESFFDSEETVLIKAGQKAFKKMQKIKKWTALKKKIRSYFSNLFNKNTTNKNEENRVIENVQTVIPSVLPIEHSEEKKYVSVEGNLYSTDGKTLIKYAPLEKLDIFIIPNNVINIKAYAFAGCTANIIWEDGSKMTTIGAHAFSGYDGIDIKVPTTIKKINRYAFAQCKKLRRITLPFIGSDANSTTNNYFSYIFGGESCHTCDTCLPNTLSEVIITAVEKIAAYSFNNCKNISRIALCKDVTNLDKYAFAGCSANIVWPSNSRITTIGESSFEGYNGTELIIPDSVLKIERGAFKGCSANIVWPSNSRITTIGESSFEGYNGTELIIPDSVLTIERGAFKGCNLLQKITIGNNVKSIAEKAFVDCRNLSTAIFKDTVGWSLQNVFNNNKMIVTERTLQNCAMAANYLRTNFNYDNIWQKDKDTFTSL